MCNVDDEEFNPAETMTKLASEHPLLKHKYLQRFSKMEYENEETVIRNFATDHYVYSRNFQVYLGNVLEKVHDNEALHLVGENLEEERGHYEEDDLDMLEENGVDRNDFNGVSHPILMKRFVTESKADPTYNEGAAREFTDLMINLTNDGDDCVGLAIMAFAIESTVSRLYQFIWEGLKKSSMDPSAYVFFPLHILIDDGHADALIQAWLNSFKRNPQSCYDNSYSAVKQILDARVS